MNQERFEQARLQVLSASQKKRGIGTLSEKSVHAVLKAYYEPYEDSHEIQLGGYIADIAGENGIIEIQTRQFGKMKSKLEAFLPFCPVTVVYPVIQERWLVNVSPETGAVQNRRKSPLHGSVWNLLAEMAAIPSFLGHPSLSFRAVLLEAEEIRLTLASKRKKVDIIPTRLIEELQFHAAGDFSVLLPPDLPSAFTSRNLAALAHIPLFLAQTGLSVLYRLGCVHRAGKQGNSYLYQRIPS